jgi:hypothetical protein
LIGPPAVRPAVQEAAGAGPRGRQAGQKLSPYVRVVNAVWNGSGFVKRKKANHYVKHKRGVFVDDDCNQLLLDMTHPVNTAFEWGLGTSDGATVWMAARVTAEDDG